MAQSAKTLFTDKAEDYAKYRPSYPEEAIDILMENLPSYRKPKVIDIGAGTGISSSLLADRGAKVVAVEPNIKMIKAANKYQNIEYVQAPAETIPMEDSSADLVTSFQSLHWFDFKQSLNEFNRILKPSGKLGIIWSYWDEEDVFTSQYVDLISDATEQNSDSISPYTGLKGKVKQLRIKILWKFRLLPYFKNVKRYRLRYKQHVDEEGLIGCARSQSYICHEGPLWHELVERIKKLGETCREPKLVYNINLFTATIR